MMPYRPPSAPATRPDPAAPCPAPGRPGFTATDLQHYLSAIDEHLIRQEQLPGHLMNDKAFLPALVDLANDKHPGLNLHFEGNAVLFGDRVKTLTREPGSSARLIVNMGEGGIHFAAFDVAKIDEKISVIGVEPATLNAMGPALLALRSQSSLGRALPQAAFVMIESDLQRSSAECGIFSLALAKKMLQEKPAFAALHKENISGEIRSLDQVATRNLLPPLLMKHAQSERRLGQYLASQPNAARQTVNKRGETLEGRQARHVVDSVTDDRTIRYSASIEVKRRKEISDLLQRTRLKDGAQDEASAQPST